MRATQINVNVVENRRENADLDRNAPVVPDELSNSLKHG